MLISRILVLCRVQCGVVVEFIVRNRPPVSCILDIRFGCHASSPDSILRKLALTLKVTVALALEALFIHLFL